MSGDPVQLAAALQQATETAARLHRELQRCLAQFGHTPDGGADREIVLTGRAAVPGAVCRPTSPRPASPRAAAPTPPVVGRGGAGETLAEPSARPTLRVVGRAGQEMATGTGAVTGSVELSGFRVDPGRHIVEVEGRQARLTPNEWQLFAALLGSPEQIFTRERLAVEAWGSGYSGRLGEVEVYVSRLRRKLEQNPRSPLIIETVRGEGYRLMSPELDGDQSAGEHVG